MTEARLMYNDKESPYTLTLLGEDLCLPVVQFSGREALNQTFRFDVEVIGLKPALRLKELLRQPALLNLGQGQVIHGVLHSASLEHHGQLQVRYKLALVPVLQSLDQHKSRRIFEQLSVPMILRQLLEEHDLPEDSYRFELATGHYPLRPFCIQYEETDLALLQRLCEEEGIHYHFEHQSDRHVLVLADDCLSFPQEPLLMPFHGDGFGSACQPGISELFQRHESPPSSTCANARSRGSADNNDGAANHAFARHRMPMHRAPDDQRYRDQQSRRHLERLRCQRAQIHGQSNAWGLRSAHILQVSDHPLSGFNDQWLVTEARHQGSVLTQDSPGLPSHYRNHFTAIPWSTVFRPALRQVRPSIPGYQPARVHGPAGQPAALDDRGRIQVSLWPAAPTALQESAAIWLPRVLTAPEAGLDQAGLPMAGTEGLVSFLDSDPDRPVFCASIGKHPPPQPAGLPKPRRDTRLLLDWLTHPTAPDS